MKRQILSILFIGSVTGVTAQNVGIGNTSFTPNASSILELRTTTGGFLMPRMTEAQRDAIVSPANGLMIYQTNNTPGYYYYDGSAWVSFGASIDNLGNHTATQNLKVGPGFGLTDMDEDTKIYLEKTADEDNVRIDVAGAEAMIIKNSGNVGIGTSLPVAELDVNGDFIVRGSDVYDNSGDIRLSGEDNVHITMDYNNNDSDSRSIIFGKNDMNSPTELMRLTETGRLGIGDVNPIANLQVYGNGSSGYTPAGGGAAGPEIGFARGGFYNGMGASIQMIDYNGYSAGLCFNVHEGVNYGGGGSFADNWPNDVIQAMTITNTGSIGIGTATPDRLLNIGSATGPQMLFTREDNSTQSGNTLGEIIFDSTDDTTPSTTDGSAMIRATASENHGNSNKGGNLSFFTKPTGTHGVSNAVQRLTILHNGNVGVGTAVPNANFHTVGSVRHGALAGSGTRMVVADGNGNLSTQAIPGGGGSSLWSQSGSDIYRNTAGDVGIGLSNPSYKFHVTQSNTGGGDNVIEFINTSSDGLVQFNDNLGTSNNHHAMESWTNKNNNGGAEPFGVFGGSYSSSNGSNGGGVYGHVNSRRGIGVLGVRGNTSGGQGFAGLFEGKLGYTGGLANLSDKRLKRNIENLEGALEIVESLRATTYYFDTEMNPHFGLSETKQFGFIAQEIEEVIPEIVLEAELPALAKERGKKESMENIEMKTFKSYDFPQLIPILTKAIQEQQDIIEDMEAKNAELEARLEAIEAKLK